MHAGECAVRTARDRTALEDLALVLAAAGIGHRLEPDGEGWRLLVDAGDAERAAAALAGYETERQESPAPPEYGNTPAGIVCGVLLVLFYAVTGPEWLRAGSASAELILRGEAWRTVTALTLHASAAHVVANALGCAVFVTAVSRTLGPGLGAWLVLLAGAGGNAVNALLRGPRHVAVGASTAIFGAIGILGGLQLWRKRRERRAWVPMAGSLALLAMLGTDERADILAHLFGLLVGAVLGIAAGLTVAKPPPRRAQWVLMLGALGAVAGCWLVALRSSSAG